MKKLNTVLGASVVVAGTLTMGACTTETGEPSIAPEDTNIVQQASVSECGGFAAQLESGSGDSGNDGPSMGAPPEYCDAEVLHWSYDATTQKLQLSNTRIELNCCGEHSMTIAKVGDVYVVTETDAPEQIESMPEGEGARCSCTCVFDFAIDAEPIAEGPIQLQVVRHVTDGSTGPEVMFEGELDLSVGDGFEIVSDTPSFWCGEMDSSVS